MSDNDGGPAFPAFETNDAGELEHNFLGMSLRDWFASQALVGLGTNVNSGFENDDCAKRARLAYKQADAMLHERENGQ